MRSLVSLVSLVSLAALIAALAVLLAFAPAARAQPSSTARAAELKKRGDDAMDSLKYTEALSFYSDAYATTHDPALLYNMGRAYEALGQYPNAEDELQQFQAQASPELRAKVPGLAQRIADVHAHVSTLRITSNVNGARVLLGNKAIGATPLAGAVRTNAGKTTLEVIAEGYVPLRREIDLKGGEETTIDAKLEPKSDTGVLVIDSPVVGADVDVDGKPAGKVPVETVVHAGSHAVVVRADGHETTKTSAVVAVGERKMVTIPLEETKPITKKWWFWTGVGVVVVAGVVTAVALTTERKADTGTYPPGQVAGPLTSAALRW